MNSPVISEGSTFADQAHISTSKQRLLDGFLIDDAEDMDGAPLSLPPLHRTSYARTSAVIVNIRVLVLALNFVPPIIPFSNPSNGGMTWFPLNILLAVAAFIPLMVPVNLHMTYKSRCAALSKGDVVGGRRMAVLVEDPVSGEERWMLEMKQKENLETRGAILGTDILAAVFLGLGIALAVAVGRREEAKKTQGMMWATIVVKSLMLAMLGIASMVSFSLCDEQKTESLSAKDDLKTSQYCVEG